MIVMVSIVDKHREPGKRHRGTLIVEVPGIENDTHFDFMVVPVLPGKEVYASRFLGQVLSKEDFIREGIE